MAAGHLTSIFHLVCHAQLPLQVYNHPEGSIKPLSTTIQPTGSQIDQVNTKATAPPIHTSLFWGEPLLGYWSVFIILLSSEVGSGVVADERHMALTHNLQQVQLLRLPRHVHDLQHKGSCSV